MSLQQRHEFDSIDAAEMLGSPELPEMLATLLELYRAKCQSEERQQETIQSLLDRLYGRKSKKSKYHPDQKLLLPKLIEESTDGLADEVADDEAIDASQPESRDDHANEVIDESEPVDEDGSNRKPKRKGGHGRSKLPSHLDRNVVERLDMDGPGCETCDALRPIIRVETSERLNYIPAKVVVDVTEVVIRGPRCAWSTLVSTADYRAAIRRPSPVRHGPGDAVASG